MTAPTNGAVGGVPAVLQYYLAHVPGSSSKHIEEFLITAYAIVEVIRFFASISGTEEGCQAKVGGASAMVAVGCCSSMGGSPEPIENAAEITFEGH